MKKLLIAIAFSTGTMFTIPTIAQMGLREAPSPEWQMCFRKAMQQYALKIQADPSAAERDICGFLNVQPGKDCDDKITALQELGFLQDEMRRFAIEVIVKPLCGDPK